MQPVRRIVASPLRRKAQAAASLSRATARTGISPSALSTGVLGSPARFRRRQLSALLDRLAFANQAGLTFEGDRDLYAQLGYSTKITPQQYRNAYERGGIAKRIVEAYPLGTWSSDIRITEDKDSKVDTPFEAAVADLFARLDIWPRLIRADILANIGRYSVLVIGAPGALDTPMPKRLKTIYYVAPLAEDNAVVSKWDENTSSPRYGRPLAYNCRLSGAPVMSSTMVARQNKQMEIHESRIIHIAEGLLEDDVFGAPRLRVVWNLLNDLMKLVGGGSEAAWLRMDPGLHLDVDPELDIDESDLDDLADQVKEYKHGLGDRVLQTRGTKLNLLAATVTAFASNATSVLELISGATGMPQRILLGSERGQLASGQDRDNWDDRRRERRRAFATPVVHRLVDRLIEHGALPAPPSPSVRRRIDAGRLYAYEVVWPKIAPLDSPGTADVLSKLASANQAQSQANGGLIVTADEMRHLILDLEPRPAEAEVPGPNANADVNGQPKGNPNVSDTNPSDSADGADGADAGRGSPGGQS